MERCPVCRARNRGETVCRRCRSDLADLMDIETLAEFVMTMAVQSLRQGNLRQAQNRCAYACRLRRTEFGEKFAGFLSQLSPAKK